MARRKAPFCTLLGYDPAVLAALPDGHVSHLDSLCQAWLLASLILAYPLGVALFLVEHSFVLAFCITLGASCMVINLLRLAHAGSGVAPEHRLSEDYRPSSLPSVLLLGLALLMSQPAQLLHSSPEANAEVRKHRAELQLSHRRARAELGDGEPDAFTEQLERCEFVVLRLGLIWQSPRTAVLWTALYLAFAMFPAILARSAWLDATVAYEQARHQLARRHMHRVLSRGRRQAARALASYPSYRPESVRALGPPLLAPGDAPFTGNKAKRAAPDKSTRPLTRAVDPEEGDDPTDGTVASRSRFWPSQRTGQKGRRLPSIREQSSGSVAPGEESA